MFTAKPTTTTDTAASDALRLGTLESEPPKKKGEAHLKPPVSNKSSVDDDGESLALKLGGGSFLPEEPVVRPNKRVRSGSPGGGGSYPMCQVDDCGADLSNAKDYHRRHKVCELHSKTTKALVGQQMQRFCQQCSRYTSFCLWFVNNMGGFLFMNGKLKWVWYVDVVFLFRFFDMISCFNFSI